MSSSQKTVFNSLLERISTKPKLTKRNLSKISSSSHSSTRSNRSSSSVRKPIIPMSALIEPVMRVEETESMEEPQTNIRNLKMICADSNVCMAFGKQRKRIIQHFDNFNNFGLITGDIKMIGQPSANGFIREIHYTKNGYNAYAILKSSRTASADNLVYEYIVGQFINIQCPKFPCFLQTYGLYFYKNDESWKICSIKKNNVNATFLKDAIKKEKEKNIYNYAKMCTQSIKASVLIEHIKNAKTISDIMTPKNITSIDHMEVITDFICNDLLYVLYQIYMPLSQLQNNFTHYDLHDGNVMLYEPVKGKYIEYHYHLADGTIVPFKSPYIAKIIDYGRCFFTYKPTIAVNSRIIYHKLCEEDKCAIEAESNNGKLEMQPCGSEFGFEWMESKPLNKNVYFINSTLENVSHDLRFLYYVKTRIDNILTILHKHFKKTFSDYYNEVKPIILSQKQVVNILQYGVGLKGEAKAYGTQPNATRGYSSRNSFESNEINNVSDAEEAIRTMIFNVDNQKRNNDVYGDPANKLGDMHIYSDGRPMEFIPVK